jgi:hypothetical protein
LRNDDRKFLALAGDRFGGGGSGADHGLPDHATDRWRWLALPGSGDCGRFRGGLGSVHGLEDHIDLPVLYNLSLLFWQLLGAILLTQILNLMEKRP